MMANWFYYPGTTVQFKTRTDTSEVALQPTDLYALNGSSIKKISSSYEYEYTESGSILFYKSECTPSIVLKPRLFAGRTFSGLTNSHAGWDWARLTIGKAAQRIIVPASTSWLETNPETYDAACDAIVKALGTVPFVCSDASCSTFRMPCRTDWDCVVGRIWVRWMRRKLRNNTQLCLL